ncbi:MAG: uroporphyrinogen decarboxylase family protein [Anaerolineae bacterium]
MTPRERVLTTLAHERPDRPPREMGFTEPALAEFRRRTGAEDPADYFDYEVRRVGLAPTLYPGDFSAYLGPLAPNVRVNEWGIGHVPGSIFHFEDYVHPLAGATSAAEIESFPLPDLLAGYRYEHIAGDVARWHDRGYAVAGGIPHYSGTLFECAWLLRGMENLLADFLTHEDIAEVLLDRLTATGVESARRIAATGIDVLVTGDDVGTQRGMMLSPALWRRWLKPRLAAIIAAAREAQPNVPVFYHSDGDISAIVPELMEIGVTILNPVQPECMDPAVLKQQYGDRLSFWGSIGTQTTMPFGTAEEVQAVVRRRIASVGYDGGLVLAPTHVIEPEVPWENVLAFFAAVDETG